MRHIQYLGRRSRSRQHQRVLFAFLVEEHIQPFLDLLLADHSHVIALLLRSVLDLAVEFGILRLQVALADLQALADRTDRLDDIRPHGRQLCVHLLDHGVVLRCCPQDTHPLQLQRVILRQTARKRSIRQTYIRRNEAVALGLVTQELINILHQTQLGLYLRHGALLGATGMEKQGCLGTDIGYVVLLFVIRYSFLRLA